MRAVIKIYMLVTFLTVSCQKDEDESRPYEFGFTIDGQQHRHEKKDVNGIIQGEFGFITADGIYHVTVYATDENGNFRILSMKNIRISAPLDGSPLPPGAKIESYPGAGNVQTSPQTQVRNQPQIQPQIQPQNQPQIQPQNQPQLQPQNHPQIQPQPQTPVLPQTQIQNQPIQTTSRPKTTYVFTTQPTIKPACGGCGYVTTPKPRPGERFPFQIPAFQRSSTGSSESSESDENNSSAEKIPGSEFGQPGSGFSQPGSGFNQPGSGFNQPGSGFNQPGSTYPGQTGQIYPSQQNANLGPNVPVSGPSYPQTGTVGASLPPPGPNYPAQGGSPVQIQGGSAAGPTSPVSGSNFPTQGFSNPTPNEISADQPRSRLSQVKVSDGVIHVPGNPDIPIRDKFPGMVDGLPEGITEKDITDLLYKFNYTVGFHGHYEKGLKNGAKVGGYFVTGRDGISRIVTYVADENGFRPKVKFVRLDLSSDEVPKEGSEKKFGLKNFEFIWYPVS